MEATPFYLSPLPRGRDGKLLKVVHDPRYFPETVWTGDPITLAFGTPKKGCYKVDLYGDATQPVAQKFIKAHGDIGHPYRVGYAPVLTFAVTVIFNEDSILDLSRQGEKGRKIESERWESFLDMLRYFQNACPCCYEEVQSVPKHPSTHSYVQTLEGPIRYDFDRKDEEESPRGLVRACMVLQNPRKKSVFIRSQVRMILHNVHRIIGDRIFGGRFEVFSYP